MRLKTMTPDPTSQPDPLCEFKEVVKHFPVNQGVLFNRQVSSVHAINGVTLEVYKGETLGLVGESGCGKTTLGRILLGLIPPTAGEVRFNGCNVYAPSRQEVQGIRGKIGAVFQDPFSSLDPRMNVSQIVAEPLVVSEKFSAIERKQKVLDLLQRVGLTADQANRYPHEFSGGQRQRISIARALALSPELIVADEPSSSLDVSIQAQVINLLQELQDTLGFSYLLISHDLNLVYHVSNRIAVMYLGKIVELAQAEVLFHHPLHPYTQALISAVPSSDFSGKKERIILKGGIQSPTTLPQGCIFSERCFIVSEECKRESPVLTDLGKGHHVACLKIMKGT